MVMGVMGGIAAAGAAVGTLGKVIDAIDPILDRFFPDLDKRAEVRNQLLAELAKFDTAQLEVNKAEAQTGNWFIAGWRPFIGWVCGAVMALYYVPYSVASIGLWAYACIQAGTVVGRPSMDMTDVMGLLGAMLGIGGLRSFEKFQGVDTKVVERAPRDAKGLAGKVKNG